MGKGNLALRNTAVPFRAVPYVGPAYVNDITAKLDGSTPPGGVMRFCRPYAGDIISAKLTLNAVAPPSGVLAFRIFKGDFQADGVTAQPLTYPLASGYYSEERLARDWKRITGFNAEKTYGNMANVYWGGLDITDLIPKRGDPDFNEDGFAIGVQLDLKGSGWVLWEFKIDCTAQLGVL